MRNLASGTIAVAALVACVHGAGAATASCQLKGSFEGADVPGAVASGEVTTGRQLALDLFGADHSHEVLITLTPIMTRASLGISLTDVKGESGLFLETTLGATVLSLSIDGAYAGARLDTLSLLCRETR